ncbi:Beta-glucosidase 2 [Colletotrichum sidae]|uniref:beta-glucosidase n=1 Tax=Colletotrichum sidae TaxID=1347389 RepID=A0A4R8T241_9PEZI|nr:Beta-glucosidase 2 [Colletotrichum sidae]
MASETLPITAALSQYPILAALAQHLSRHDMFNLGWTCRRYHSYIHESDFFFKNLTRHAPCDGRGLAQRLAFEEGSMLARLHRDFFEEPVEVRLRDNSKCDADDTLPCVKCGTNVCEECRVYPRWPEGLSYSFGRPHLNETCAVKNVMCLCPECDRVMEEKVQGHFLDERCDCNVYTRWICYDCVELLEDTTATYYRLSTKRPTRNSRDFVTKSLPDGYDDIILAYARAKSLTIQMTFEELANFDHGWIGLCTGNTDSVSGLGVTHLYLQDGPDWINIGLGPVGGSLARIARGGRTSGGISADPYISAIGVGATTKSMQGAAAIACPKHWLLNEQEYLAQFVEDVVAQQWRLSEDVCPLSQRV